MHIPNVYKTTCSFEVLQTSGRSQTAVMVLDTDGKSSEKMNVHEKSDQVLLVVEGEVHGEIGSKQIVLHKGDVCIVPAGTPHRFENKSKYKTVTFNVYSPPEYDSNEKG
jgi:mannose-6-phosphate isomerase-like protein (cupin superfamily)